MIVWWCWKKGMCLHIICNYAFDSLNATWLWDSLYVEASSYDNRSIISIHNTAINTTLVNIYFTGWTGIANVIYEIGDFELTCSIAQNPI